MIIRLSNRKKFDNLIINLAKALFVAKNSQLPLLKSPFGSTIYDYQNFFCCGNVGIVASDCLDAGFWFFQTPVMLSKEPIYPLGLPKENAGLRLPCCESSCRFNNYLFGTSENLSYFCNRF